MHTRPLTIAVVGESFHHMAPIISEISANPHCRHFEFAQIETSAKVPEYFSFTDAISAAADMATKGLQDNSRPELALCIHRARISLRQGNRMISFISVIAVTAYDNTPQGMCIVGVPDQFARTRNEQTEAIEQDWEKSSAELTERVDEAHQHICEAVSAVLDDEQNSEVSSVH